MKFILQGANLDTGNLGVSALFASTVQCIAQAYPGATIQIMEGSRTSHRDTVKLPMGEAVQIGCVGVRRNKTLWRRNHLVRLLLQAALLRLVFPRLLRKRLLQHNPHLQAISEARCVADITGGDSYSDIYGLRRLVIGTLYKLLVLLVGTDLVLLPQTYGPFKSRLSRSLARMVLSRATAIYSRDRESLEVLQRVMAARNLRSTPQLSRDVAFLLDPVAPQQVTTRPGPLPEGASTVLVGMNVSGLLYHGGYTRDNMFSLAVDYRRLVEGMARALLEKEGTSLLLIPHVYAPPGNVESDTSACRQLFDALHAIHRDRVFLLEGEYGPSEIKHVIGLCDFFLGSRMHACIAAASQGISTVPLAYSNKFVGVFETIGAGDLVGDLRSQDAESLLKHVLEVFENRGAVRQKLQAEMQVTQEVLKETFLKPFSVYVEGGAEPARVPVPRGG